MKQRGRPFAQVEKVPIVLVPLIEPEVEPATWIWEDGLRQGHQ